MTTNKQVLDFVQSRIDLCQPDNVVWIDGSKELYDKLTAQSVAIGELIPLSQEGCYLHRTKENDVARVEDRTFICSRDKANSGPTNNWWAPEEAYEKMNSILAGSYKGRTMYVIPFSMGPVGGPISKVGIEVTDSIYVVLNMRIMTRVGKDVLDALGDSNDFVRGTHAKCDIDPEHRYICHFPEDNAILSVNSGYGGNVLLGKKCFALRIASYQGRKEAWMAEHMLILGIEKPNKETIYMAAAFPSACGKTNLAMLIPPEGYIKDGYKVYCVGDDIAWIKKGPDGRLYAINPENGFFGVAPGTNVKSNFNALESTKKNTIFTNVVHNLETNNVWWEGLDKNPPEKAIDWLGNAWNGKTATTKGAHANSRFTAPAINCPCISPEFESPSGVPISAFIFGGRRPSTVPLVYQATSWENGVFIGSSMGSETTAAAAGKVGVVRRDPMAMRPFCGYHMGDYFQHWLDMGAMIDKDKQPKFFNVNWFRVDEEGNFLWPGFGDNMRVLDWMLKRIAGEVDAVETPIGYVPYAKDINLDGLDMTQDDLQAILDIDNNAWKNEAEGIKSFYAEFGDKLPKELAKQADALADRLNK